MKGITITLHERTKTGVDKFNHPVYSYIPVEVEDVLVGEPTTDDITNATAMHNAKVAYMLGIPKGDSHKWEGGRVTLPYPMEGTYPVIGKPISGIETLIPGRWNKKVKLEAINEE